MDKYEFEGKWLSARVKVIGHYDLPDKEYRVTAALYEPKETIFAIMALDYTPENKHWFTIRMTEEEVDKINERFEIIK